MANVLGLDTCKHYKERQTNLQSKVKSLLDEKFHCLLNDIFHVQVTSWCLDSCEKLLRGSEAIPLSCFMTLHLFGFHDTFLFLSRASKVVRKWLPILEWTPTFLRYIGTRLKKIQINTRWFFFFFFFPSPSHPRYTILASQGHRIPLLPKVIANAKIRVCRVFSHIY